MNNSNLHLYINDILLKNNYEIKNKLAIKCLHDCLDSIIFNIISIACIICYINNSKSISNQTLTIMNAYIIDNCSTNSSSVKKTGGNSIVMPSEFYGVDSGRYSPANITNDILNIDFNSQTLRPQIGGGIKKNHLTQVIDKLLDYYKIKASKQIINKIIKIIDNYVNCLICKLKTIKKPVTNVIIKQVIKKNKLFKIFS